MTDLSASHDTAHAIAVARSSGLDDDLPGTRRQAAPLADLHDLPTIAQDSSPKAAPEG